MARRSPRNLPSSTKHPSTAAPSSPHEDRGDGDQVAGPVGRRPLRHQVTERGGESRRQRGGARDAPRMALQPGHRQPSRERREVVPRVVLGRAPSARRATTAARRAPRGEAPGRSWRATRGDERRTALVAVIPAVATTAAPMLATATRRRVR